MTTVKIAGREIPLVFNLDSWFEMEDAGLKLSELNVIFSRENTIEKPLEVIKATLTIARIFGNQGLELRGDERDITDEWLRKSVKPSQVMHLRMAVIDEIDKGMGMETHETKEGQERDLVLEEINQKKTSAK